METAWASKPYVDAQGNPRDAYTLSKMTTEEYIRDPRFKAWGLCWKELGDEGAAIWVRRQDLPRFFASIDWSRTAVVAHNAQFDVSIMAWHYHAVPAFIFDSLSMARALRGVEVGNSLAKLAEDLGLPPKGKAVHSTDGLLDTLPFEVEVELADYCRHDVFLTEHVFADLNKDYPRRELELIDLTLKMFVRPLLELDADLLKDAIDDERATREALLTRLGVKDKDLASNDKFAQVLASIGVEAPRKPKKPTKKTPSPVGTLYAFAKSDAMFQAMLNSDNDTLSLLCEARLKVKSTLERTRAQRFFDISQRGTLPVPLSYYGTLTGRWSASKGSSLNMQNLKRGSFLRKAIMAPAGYSVCVTDLSQIEPRVLAYLSDYAELLNIFRAGKDPYAAFGATMFNIPGMTKESHPELRQSAKSALLGCFAPETRVLTQRGWVPIIQVDTQDLLWDGVEWVQHKGVVDRGVRETELAYGVRATSDHEILTELGWRGWSEVHRSPSLFKSALRLANSLASIGSGWGSAFIRACGVLAAGRASLRGQTLRQAGQRAVEDALGARLWRRAGSKKGTFESAPTARTVRVFLTASAQSLFAAPILKAPSIQTMAGGALACIRRGSRIARSFLRTSSNFLGGTTQRFNLTDATTNAATCPATFASVRAARTWPTSVESRPVMSKPSNGALPILRQSLRVYDIALAGPRNRYTILTDAGPIIVHNCGYYLGWASFAQQLLTGFLGAPPVRYDKAFAEKLGLRKEDALEFVSGKPGADRVKRMADIPHTCTDAELFTHCLCAKRIIDTYRATSAPVVRYWGLLGKLIESSLYGGRVHQHKCLRFEKERIVLPNGMALQYPDLKPEQNEEGNVEWTYLSGKVRKKLHAGVLAENTTSALARIVMTDGMVRLHKRYPVVMSVHDEAVSLIPDEEVVEGAKWCHAQMVREPKYMPGIPLGADTGVHRRYGLAKN
jgi:hypothetical protein